MVERSESRTPKLKAKRELNLGNVLFVHAIPRFDSGMLARFCCGFGARVSFSISNCLDEKALVNFENRQLTTGREE